MSKRLGGIIGYKGLNLLMGFKWVPRFGTTGFLALGSYFDCPLLLLLFGCLHFKNRSDLYPVQHSLCYSSGKETNFRGPKLTQNKVQKIIKKDPEKIPTLAKKNVTSSEK